MIAYGDKEPELAEPKIVGEKEDTISYKFYYFFTNYVSKITNLFKTIFFEADLQISLHNVDPWRVKLILIGCIVYRSFYVLDILIL